MSKTIDEFGKSHALFSYQPHGKNYSYGFDIYECVCGKFKQKWEKKPR